MTYLRQPDRQLDPIASGNRQLQEADWASHATWKVRIDRWARHQLSFPADCDHCLRCNLLRIHIRLERLEGFAAYAANLPPTLRCSAAAGPWMRFSVACRPQRTSTRCGGRPPFLTKKDNRTTWVNTLALTIERALFGYGTVVLKPSGAPFIDPGTLRVEVFLRVCYL